MNHPSEKISAYLDGELHGSELTRLHDHLVHCGRCSAELAKIQEVRSAVRSLPIVELPSGLVPESEAEVVPLRRHKGMWTGVAAAVLAAVVAVAALVTPDPGSISIDQLTSQFGARESLHPAHGPMKVVVPPVGGE